MIASHRLFTHFLVYAFASLGLAPLSAQEKTEAPVWDTKALFEAPEFRWLDETSPVRSLLYSGERYRDHDTEVFAFYASPATLDPSVKGPFPAVVLIHGGGGTAFSEWTWLWAKRGYAAIAMDLGGQRSPAPEFKPGTSELIVPDKGHKQESRTPLENSGPGQGHPEKFDSIGEDVSNHWPWHAVSNAVCAHSLIRSFPEVDADHTAVTGISWGGYTTCLVASVDSRFKAAVPVYGCGFLFEGESVQKKSIDALSEENRAKWIKRYDPSSHLGNCQIPILFVNGSHDIHYPLDSYQKSFDRVPGNTKQMCIEPRMRHSHPAGWEPQEIGLFIDSFCKGGAPLPKPGTPVVGTDGKISVTIENSVPVASAALHYTTATGLRSEREWKEVDAVVDGTNISAPAPPADANTWFLTITDENGAMISTTVQFSPATKEG